MKLSKIKTSEDMIEYCDYCICSNCEIQNDCNNECQKIIAERSITNVQDRLLPIVIKRNRKEKLRKLLK